ncbi:MAG: GIN domain-containing protein [Flavobacteriales bacterium]
MRIALIIIAIVLVGCKKSADRACFKSNGKETSEIRQLDSFTTLGLNGLFKLKLVEDTETYCRITGPENLIPFISTEVSNGIIRINDLNKCRFLRSYQYEINIELHGNNWQQITSYGPTYVYSTDTLTISSLRIDGKKSSNDFNLILKGDTLYTDLSGPTDLILEGLLDFCYLYHTGTGNVNTHKLVAPFLHVHSRGIGDFRLQTFNTFIAEVRSEGNVYYRGTPATLLTDVTGKGKLVKE